MLVTSWITRLAGFTEFRSLQGVHPTSVNVLVWCRNSNFRLRLWLQHLNVLGSGSKIIWSIENGRTLYYLRNSLAPQARAVEPEPKFQAPAPII